MLIIREIDVEKEVCNFCLDFFQAHLVGCVFDNFTPSFNARSYVVTLLIVAWIVPMTIIVACYAGILVSVRKSFIEFVARTREERIRRKV